MSNQKSKILADVGSERAVLSGICHYSKDAFYDVCDIISTNTFTIEANKALFKVLSECIKESEKLDTTSVITKAAELKLNPVCNRNSDDLAYINSLFKFPILLNNVRNHAKRIAKLEIARKAQQKHQEAFQALQEVTGSETVDEILQISEKPVFDLTFELNNRNENNPVILGSIAKDYLTYVKENPCENIGIPSPFSRWNDAIGGGFRVGGVDLVVTRPKNRKSTFALITALHVAGKLGIPVLYLDTEMMQEQQIVRALANLARVRKLSIEKGDFSDNEDILFKQADYLNNIPLYYKSISGTTIDEILSVIRRWVIKDVKMGSTGKTNPCLVIHDYFKIMSMDELEQLAEFQAIGFHISKMIDLAKEYQVPILSFTQVNREGLNKETTDIISQSDRFLWLCNSISFMKKKTPEEIMEDGRDFGNMKIKVLDCRHGPDADGNYINLQLEGDMFDMHEIGTYYDMKKQQIVKEEGFESNGEGYTQF